jgi:glycine/D-amino acid oxidase-like deaminating enzyme
METIVVGGGLGGLAAATLLARGGRRVTLVERATGLGGRARSQVAAGATLNLGPHALYDGGRAAGVLDRLGVAAPGRAPTGSAGWYGGRTVALPGSAAGLATMTWLSWRERAELAWVFARLGAVARGEGTVAAWLAELSPAVAAVVGGFVRLATYGAAVDVSAGPAARQLALALRGVRYLDGGWGGLVDRLAGAAAAAGVTLRMGGGAKAADADGVWTEDGRLAGEVVLAVPPEAARALGVAVPSTRPVRAACLDLVLDRAPDVAPAVIVGLDAPLYLSDHGRFARLGGVVVHAARYLGPDEPGDVASIEALLDATWPGWRARVVHRRWLPAMSVAGHAPRPDAPMAPRRVDGVWLVGDHVEAGAMLADAALGSADDVAAAVLGGRLG